MIDATKFAAWWAALTDRFNRPMQPGTQAAYYAQLSPLLTTEEFERAAALVFRDETFWPAPRVFVEKVRSNAPATYRALPSGAPGTQTFGGGCFERDAMGQDIEHKTVCACGRPYLQYCLSIPWLERLSDGARRAMLAEFPVGRCPTECPRCARKILATGISYPDTPRDRERPGAEWAA